MKTILVTGGAGFVGSHACKALARTGYLPVTFDNLEHGHERAVKWGPLERGDLRNANDLARVFEARRPWAVMHFAAYAYVGESMLDPAKYYNNNVGGSAKLLQACAAFGCQNVVFSSSCATYGVPERLPLTEDAAQNPVNPYGYTKLVVERMLRDAEAAYGIRHVALRYFNAAGADPDGELGELHLPETHLIPLVLFAAMGRTPSIKIFGHDYLTPDGTCIRDYVHVSDLADAHVAAIDWLAAGKPSVSFNLGNGRGFSVAEVVRASEKVTGRSVPTEMCARRPGDPPVLVSDSSKARELLGWTPKFPELDRQIMHAWTPRQDAQHLKKRNPYLRWPHLSERSRSAIKWTAKFWGWFSRSHHIVLNTERLPVDGQKPRSLAEPLQGEPLIPDLSMMGPHRSISNLTFSRNCSED